MHDINDSIESFGFMCLPILPKYRIVNTSRHGVVYCIFFFMRLREMIDANARWCQATEQRLGLPSDKTLWQKFEDEAAALIRALPDGAVVLDLGGGRRCVYARAVDPPGRLRLVAIDISAEELALNRDVAETYAADVATGLPMPDGSVDLILSRALLEHVDGVGTAVQHMARVLKPGGVALHIIPCRYSLFGMAARLLPFGPLLRLTHAAMPATRDDIGFAVHYDDCYPQALGRDFRAAGFKKVQMQLTWACPGYFTAFYPLFLAHALYEQTVRRLGIRRLAAYVVVKATR
jgi:SAM-dependent methyltransferase